MFYSKLFIYTIPSHYTILVVEVTEIIRLCQINYVLKLNQRIIIFFILIQKYCIERNQTKKKIDYLVLTTVIALLKVMFLKLT